MQSRCRVWVQTRGGAHDMCRAPPTAAAGLPSAQLSNDSVLAAAGSGELSLIRREHATIRAGLSKRKRTCTPHHAAPPRTTAGDVATCNFIVL